MERHTHPMLAVLTVAALAFALPFALAAPLNDDGSAKSADKVAAAESDTQYLSADFVDVEGGVTILSATLKTSGPSDLLVAVSLECALWTEVVSTTVENHPDGLTPYSDAMAHVDVWMEIDGKAVPLGDSGGKVTFCSRVHEQEFYDLDDTTGNLTLRQYLETKSANAFNFFALDLGSGYHTVDIKADIQADSTEGAFAEGAIGARTLTIEPVKFPTGTTL